MYNTQPLSFLTGFKTTEELTLTNVTKLPLKAAAIVIDKQQLCVFFGGAGLAAPCFFFVFLMAENNKHTKPLLLSIMLECV